jgi:hypothetical protein
MESSKTRVVGAVNLLILSPNYAKLVAEIRQIAADYDEHPMAYSGKLTPLNALIDVALQSTPAFDKLIELADNRRKLIPEMKRTDYQRNIMQERRDRIRKVLKLHEARSGKISGAERKTFETETQARWMKARDEYIASKGELSWKDRNTAAQEFWDSIDRNLDEAIADLPAPAK